MKDNQNQNLIVEGAQFGTMKILSKIDSTHGNCQCMNCGYIRIASKKQIQQGIKEPNKHGCAQCVDKDYTIGEKIGCLTLVAKVSKDKGRVKCTNCGEELEYRSTDFSKLRKNPPTVCKICKKAQPKNGRKHKIGDIVGPFQLLSIITGGSKGMVKCIHCGRVQEYTLGNIFKRKDIDHCFYCTHPNAKTNFRSVTHFRGYDIEDVIYNRYKSKILLSNDKGEKYKDGTLTKEEYLKLVYGNCYYCGAEPTADNQGNKGTEKRKTIKNPIKVNGIDRLDSSKGYIPENCVPCCGSCNVMKSTLPEQVFLNKIEQIYNYRMIRDYRKDKEPSRVDSSESKREDSKPLEYDIVRSSRIYKGEAEKSGKD